MDELQKTMQCPVHDQPIAVVRDENSKILSAICTCKVDGKNKFAGVVVWMKYPDPPRAQFVTSTKSKDSNSKGE